MTNLLPISGSFTPIDEHHKQNDTFILFDIMLQRRSTDKDVLAKSTINKRMMKKNERPTKSLNGTSTSVQHSTSLRSFRFYIVCLSIYNNEFPFDQIVCAVLCCALIAVWSWCYGYYGYYCLFHHFIMWLIRKAQTLLILERHKQSLVG